MSKADEIFYKLGYGYATTYENGLFYHNGDNDRTICFDRVNKKVSAYNYDTVEAIGIDINELQVINQKAKELGWFDE